MKIKHKYLTKTERRKKLINNVIDISAELEYIESEIPDLLKKIKKLKPTKKELQEDLQELMDEYLSNNI